MEKFNENKFLKKEEILEKTEEKIDKWQNVIEMPVVKEENPEWKIEELEDILTASVKNCLAGIEKGEIAISLSGGLDSSLITALARKVFPEAKIKTFTLGSKENPDLKFAKKVAEILKTEHHEFVPSTEEINKIKVEIVEKGLKTENLVESLTYNFAKSLGIKTIISAEGGDELFGGYWWHQKITKNIEEKYGKNQKEIFENTWKNFLREHLLQYEQASQTYNTELRFPFLQKDVVEFISHIPLKDRCTLSQERYPDQKDRKKPEREIALNYLPKEIVYRQKRGFPDALSPEVE